MTLSELNKSIEESNVAFAKMSKAKKRVEIAKDTIQRVLLGQLKPNIGNIIAINLLVRRNENYSIRDVINNDDEFNCSVCAKGALLMGYVGRVNEMQFGQAKNSNDGSSAIHTKLAEIFTLEQLALIEVAFEGNQYLTFCSNNIDRKIIVSEEDYDKADKFYAIQKKEDRLIAICKNIIENKGTFKP
jgi:hypothetical protein